MIMKILTIIMIHTLFQQIYNLQSNTSNQEKLDKLYKIPKNATVVIIQFKKRLIVLKRIYQYFVKDLI